MSDAETLEREPESQMSEFSAKEQSVADRPEETFEVNGAYLAEQAREAMRIFFLPLTSLVRAAQSKARAVRRDIRRIRHKAA